MPNALAEDCIKGVAPWPHELIKEAPVRHNGKP
jgi:hypothetical protein